MTHLSYRERAQTCLAPLAKNLFDLFERKKTNLCLAADVTSAQELIDIADELGPEICILKTHIDIVADFTPDLIGSLKKLADKHKFFLFEDRKFADIGNTVKHQYAGGIYKIASWADLVNAHSFVGPSIINGLRDQARPNAGFILIAELSAKGHLMTAAYAQQTLEIAEQFPEHIVGFITQKAVTNDPKWINMTPGVQIDGTPDGLGQQYITPEQAIIEKQADVIIVGRGILSGSDRLKTAQEYRIRGYKAYLQRLGL